MNFFQNLPESFAHCQYDFSCLLHGVGNSTATPSYKTILCAMEILSHTPHKYKWFKKVCLANEYHAYNGKKINLPPTYQLPSMVNELKF